MLGQILTVTALVALTQAKAIVTNNCPFKVYVWSVPDGPQGSVAENIPIKAGGRYQEPWRYGSLTNPGVSIKISSRTNGIYEGADEINFAYAIDPKDDSKIWVDLSKVRGEPPKALLHTCNGGISATDAGTVQCAAKDEVELVLCAPARSTLATDTASLEQIRACYGDKLAAKDDDSSDSSDSDDSDDSDWYEEATAPEAPNPSPPMSPSAAPVASPAQPGTPHCKAKVLYKRPQRSANAANTDDADQPPSLCDIIHKYHPGRLPECNEKTMMDRAWDVYPNICHPAYEALLMGFPCEQLTREFQTKILRAREDAVEDAGLGVVTFDGNNSTGAGFQDGGKVSVASSSSSSSPTAVA